MCQCVPATEVDHIVPRVFGGIDEESNLADICHFCHKYKPQIDSEDHQKHRELFETYKASGGILLQHYRVGIVHALEEAGIGFSTPKIMKVLVSRHIESCQELFVSQWEKQDKESIKFDAIAKKVSETHQWHIDYAKSVMFGGRRGKGFHPVDIKKCKICTPQNE